MKVLTLMVVIAGTMSFSGLQQDKVSLSIIDSDGSEKRIEFDWPFNGPPPVGADTVLVTTVDNLLKENGVDCPNADLSL
ncbi:MAG: hypothetical protein O2951_12650 [Bacteroidetes bacterium]|nr:hypothetical protein [Bacteroidota bacterium]